MTIHTTSFRHLDIETLYDILQLRSEVFVVEQDCVYQDLDGIDKKAMHSWIAEDGKMVAYARFFMKNECRKMPGVISVPNSSILDLRLMPFPSMSVLVSRSAQKSFWRTVFHM